MYVLGKCEVSCSTVSAIDTTQAVFSHCRFWLQEDSLQFFKREQTKDAVYDVYLKKVLYHTSPDDVGIGTASHSNSVQSSTFYRNIPASITKFQIGIQHCTSLHKLLSAVSCTLSRCFLLVSLRIGCVASLIVI